MTKPNQSAIADLTSKEGYAESVIDGQPEKFDAVELHGCREHIYPDEPHRNFVEQDDENPQYWSVFLHYKTGGLDCVGDFATLKQAEDYAETVSNRYGYEGCDSFAKKPETELYRPKG